jgi:hypothetical protein
LKSILDFSAAVKPADAIGRAVLKIQTAGSFDSIRAFNSIGVSSKILQFFGQFTIWFKYLFTNQVDNDMVHILP